MMADSKYQSFLSIWMKPMDIQLWFSGSQNLNSRHRKSLLHSDKYLVILASFEDGATQTD
jgi:hypothetical protein